MATDLNFLDYHVRGAILEKYKAYTPQPTRIKAELKTELEAIWEVFPQNMLDQAVMAFRKATGVHTGKRKSL